MKDVGATLYEIRIWKLSKHNIESIKRTLYLECFEEKHKLIHTNGEGWIIHNYKNHTIASPAHLYDTSHYRQIQYF